MESDNDFSLMFEVLDTKRKGFLTVEEITSFYHSLFGHTVGFDLANAAIQRICSNATCGLEHFQNVLILFEEWRQLENKAYWDFLALDKNGSGLIPLSSALFLARSVKGADFSIEQWNSWKDSTQQDKMRVCWEDFKSYLYFKSGSQGIKLKNETEYEKLHNSLSKKELNNEVDDYLFYKAASESDEVYSAALLRQKQDYQDDVQSESTRLVNRWNVGGVEAVIHDDGAEWDFVDQRASKDDVSITELLAALDEKYDILRDKLLWEIVRIQSGNDTSRKPSNLELEEKFAETKSREKEMRKNDNLHSQVNMLYGCDVTYSHDLRIIMGETADTYEEEWEETKKRYAGYKSQGISTQQINNIFEKENLENMKNSSTTGGNVLVQLWKRQKEEKEQIIKRIKQRRGAFDRLAIFTALYRQCERAREGMDITAPHSTSIGFEGSASGASVAERKQTFEPTRYSNDTARQERFAAERLRVARQHKKSSQTPEVGDRLKDTSQNKNLPAVESWMEVTKLLEKKHNAEREMMVHFLQTMGGMEKNIKQLDVQKQERRKVELSRIFESWKTPPGSSAGKENKQSKRPYQLSVLHEGLALYREKVKRDATDKRDGEIAARILAQLQILQDIQFQDVQEQLKTKTIPEIYQLRKAEYRAIRDEHFENIGFLIFGTEKLSSEEQRLVDVILKKYDLLREKLFVEQLRYFNDEEKAAKALDNLKDEERGNRGNRDSLDELCKRMKITYSADDIFGPLYSQFNVSAQAKQNEKRSIAIEEGTLSDGRAENILSELDIRYRDECLAILSYVRESSDANAALRHKIDEQLWEIATLDGDKSFLPSAIALGLFERAHAGRKKLRLREDTTRYIRCAQERYVLPEPFNEKGREKFTPDNPDAAKSLQFLALRHNDEWKHLRTLMNDETAEELREAASLMTLDERVQRLADINAKRKTLDLSQPDANEDLLSLLEEAAAIKHVSRKDLLRQIAGDKQTSNEDVYISLLADLHEEQLHDGFHWFDDVFKANSSDSSTAVTRIEAHMDGCENIFNILCKYEGNADDDDLLQALEDKYDSLRDKLLAEALMRQMGEDAWRRLSERERQQRLLKLKLEEQRLRNEGKMDELARLLGDAFANDARMKGLLGESREMYEKRLKERLEAMKRGEALPEEDVEDLSSSNGSNNPLLDLASRLDEERDALMRLLNGQDDAFMSEKERQAALLRLRQSRLKADGEDRYDAAALVSGLVDRESAAERRLTSDRERQRELARQRLADLKKRAGRLPTISEGDEFVVRDGVKAAMEESVLKKLRFLQSWERAQMASLLASERDPFRQSGAMSVQQITDRLQDSRSKVPSGQVVVQDHLSQLSDAAFYRQVALARHMTEQIEQSRDELNVMMLAGLQEVQSVEEATAFSTLTEMSAKELIAEQEKLVSMIKSGSSKNIPEYLFSSVSSFDAEQDLIDALSGKYDAIIDGLAAKVLPEKVGISNWDNMSAEERQEKIADLSSRVKELMNNGNFDEALNLLAEGLSEDKRNELIKELLGDEEERRSNDLKEREKRREDRIRNGMSPEEADRLFREEGLVFEENEKKRRRNVLEGLKMDFDAERDALLKSLKDAKDRLEAERKRQALLAQLKLQERRLRRESELSTMMKLLAMSRDLDDALGKDKQRQLDLARARIEAMKRRKASGLDDETDELEHELRLDSDNVVVLADVVMREMEAKHASERTVLIKLMELSGPENDFRKKCEAYSSSEANNRVRELRDMRRQWRNEDPQTLLETSEEHWDILKEASALQLTLFCAMKSVGEVDAQTFILADLQNEQKKESASIFSDLLNKKPETVRMMAQVQRRARVECWYDNVATSLLGSTEEHERKEEEAEVVKALEEKYDALKDKLLAEALLKKLGENQWASLSEEERQRRITQIKREEQRLRRQGKYDELASLFEALAITEDDIARMFGEERTSQEEDLKKRKQRIRQLRKERTAKGLPIDDDEIMKEIDEEERKEKQTRKNILLTLDRNLDAEREAILSGLRRQEDSISEERRRQLAVAKLRRQRRQVEADEKISAISFLFETAKRDEATLSASQAADRERQAAVIAQRLSAKATQKQCKQAVASLTDPAKIYEKVKAYAGEKNEGSSAERILLQMEKKHSSEKETLRNLFLAIEENSRQKEVKNASSNKIEEDLQNFAKHRKDWREERMMKAIGENGDIPLTDAQLNRLSRYVAEMNKDLITAMTLKTEATYRERSTDSTKGASIKEAVMKEWLADLAHTQENEIETTTDLMAEKSDEILDLLTEDQKRARREGWNDNIAKVVFGLSLPGHGDVRPSSTSSSIEQEEMKIEEEAKERMKEIEEELLEEKKRLDRKRASGEEIDAETAMSELEKQFAARKAALTSGVDRQRKQMRERLRERRRRKADTEYEAHAAAGMVILAEQRLVARESRNKSEASKQRSLMQQRLAARREKRRLEQEEKEKKDDNSPKISSAPVKPSSPSPFDAMRERQKTVIDISVSEKEKEEVMTNLMKKTQEYQTTLMRGRERQAAALARKLEDKRKKGDAAEALMREKTIYDQQRTQALDRQKTMLFERVSTIKTSRTMTMKETKKKEVHKFSKMVDESGGAGGDKNEKMEKVAEEIQNKLMQESKEEKQTALPGEANADPNKAAAPPVEDLPPRPQTASRKLGDADQIRIVNERRRKRKRVKQEELETVTED